MPKFTQDEIVAALHEVMLDRGADHVYEPNGISCFYRTPRGINGEDVFASATPIPVVYTDGEPGCVIGHLFDRLGTLPKVLGYATVAADDEPYHYARQHSLPLAEGTTVEGLLPILDIELDADTQEALQVFQGDQDMGNPWRSGAWEFCHRLGIDYDEFMAGVTPEGRLTR